MFRKRINLTSVLRLTLARFVLKSQALEIHFAYLLRPMIQMFGFANIF